MKGLFKTCVIFFLFIAQTCYAQHKAISDTCKGITNVAFVESRVVPFDRNILVNKGYLSPLYDSDAEVELRVYSQENLPFVWLKQIRFSKDSIIIARYQIFKAPMNIGKNEEWYQNEFKDLKFLGIKAGIRYYVMPVINVLVDKVKYCRLLGQLVNSHITDLPNGDILDSLAKEKFPSAFCPDCSDEVVYELKVGQKIRNYVDLTYMYESRETAEATIKELGYRRNILNTISEIENLK